MAFSCFQWIVGGWSQQLTAGDQKHAPEGEVSAETCVESWISTDAAGWSQQLTTGDQKHAPEVETAEPKLKVLPTLNLPVLDGPGESPSETKTAPEGDDGDVKADKADKVTKNTSKRNARLPLMVQAVELPDYVPILPRSQDDEKWPLVTKVEVLKKWEAPKRPPKPMPQIVTGRRQDRRFYGKALKRVPFELPNSRGSKWFQVPRWDPRPADYASLPEGMLLVFSQDGRRAIGQQPPDRCNAIPAIPLVYRVHHPIAAQSSWQVQISQPPGLRMVAVPAVPA